MGDLIGDNEALEDLIAEGPGDLTDTFLATSTLTAALIAGGFSIGSTLRLRGEESSGRAEPVLATAVSRGRWAASHLFVALVGSVVVLVAYGLGAGATYGIATATSGTSASSSARRSRSRQPSGSSWA